MGVEALESDELMYSKNLLSCGDLESSANCEEDSRRLPDEMVSR